MLLKVTEKCSMGCAHCLSDCKPEEKHMTIETFQKALNFWLDSYHHIFGGVVFPDQLIISGGEPFEHPQIKEFLEYIAKRFESFSYMMTVTTNGDYLSKNPKEIEYYKQILPKLKFQVVIDDRYYPVHVDTEELKKHSNVLVCQDVQAIYPIGRARTNNIPHNRKSSQCFNIRAISKQTPTYGRMMMQLIVRGKFCTPCIEYDGSIKVGESQLCPPCSDITKSFDQIYEDIKSFKCTKCNFLNDKLPEEYRRFVI